MMEITTTNGQYYYDLFYFLAIVFTGVFFMIDGKRKNYPMADWALIFSSGIIFLIIGTKLFTYTPNEWKEIITSGVFPYTERKTILGGIIGGIVGIWVAKKLIRFPFPVLDSFAVSFPVAMAIQRVGCLMAGCCYGTTTDVPWAVSYSCHSVPYLFQQNMGMITGSSGVSLPIHPNQIYQTLLCLSVAFVVWKLKNIWKRPGNLFFTSITLYWIVRFGLEFWRESSSNGIAGIYWHGLKYVQWSLLSGVILMSAFILIRERMFSQKATVFYKGVNPVWYFIFMCFLVLALADWFTRTEFLFIQLVVAPVALILVHTMIRQEAAGFRFKLASIFSLLFIFLIAGVISAQDLYDDLTSTKASRNIFNDVSFGYGGLQYSHYHSKPIEIPSGCGGTYPEPVGPLFKHHSNLFAAGISHTRTYGQFQKLTLNGELAGGWDTGKDKDEKKSIGIFDVAPSLQYDFHWIGVGFGAHLGMNNDEILYSNFYYSLNDKAKGYASLSWSLRFFPYDIFYMEFRRRETSPYQTGHRQQTLSQVALGSGLGFKNGSGIELGTDPNVGLFFSAKAFVKNKYGLKASVYPWPRDNITQVVQFTATYRFSQKNYEKKLIENPSKADLFLSGTIQGDTCDVIITKKGENIRCVIVRETSVRIIYTDCIVASPKDSIPNKEEKFILRADVESYKSK